MRTLKRLLLTASMCCLIATANAAPMDDAKAAYERGDYAQALKILKPLAAQGHAGAQYNLGNMYDNGEGVTQDYKEAVKWYKLAAAQGNAKAQFNLGWMYYTGYGVTRDDREAVKWWKLAAAQGNPEAIANLKLPEVLAAAQDPTPHVINNRHANAAPMDDADAAYTIDNASIAYDKGDYKEALRIWRPLAAKGDAIAQLNLGLMYIIGKGVTQDEKEAMKWFRLAAAQGNARAQRSIGLTYYHGFGVAKDYEEAVKWYRLAADQGDAEAISNLKLPEMLAAAQDPTPAPTTKTETQKKASPPKLVFNASTPKSDGTVELSGRVISDASISEILINGRALEVSLGRDNSFKVTRGLPMGVATSYRLSVMDEYGQRVETEINVERAAMQYTEQVALLNPRKLKAKTNPNAVALIIGIEAYSRLPKAQYADSDASHFYDYANQALGVPANKIKLLTDTKANRVDLLQAMKSWMRTEVNGKSDVYIFFAGHGLASADGSKTYLLPADGDRDLLDETSILRDDLIASSKGAKTITMFLDTCYSGGTRTNEILLADARPIAIVPDKSALPLNVTVLAAASGAQLSSTYEAAKQGLFSYWLMKGLEGDADTNKDKKITAGELHEYVSKQVGPMAQSRNRQQDPQLMGDSTRVLVSY